MHHTTDPVNKVAIVLPGQYLNGNVPMGIVLLYSSQVTTRYGTNNTGRIHYSWDFDDGFTSDMATVEHTYSQAGTYQLTLEVFNFQSASNSTTLHVYQSKLLAVFSGRNDESHICTCSSPV